MLRLNKHEWLFIIIIILAIAMRYYDMTHAGYDGDMVYFNAEWARDIRNSGLFPVYAISSTTNYPPIFLFILALTSGIAPPFINNTISIDFIILTKLFSVIAEVVLIGIIYGWIPRNTRLKWVIPLVLAIHPGMIATTAFWGQTDSILTLLLVLSILALNGNNARMAWIWFAFAMLMKFQGIVLLPMVGLLSLRRFGLRSTIHGILLGAGIFSVVYAPFVMWSGFDNAIRPFTGAVDLNPVITGNAFNLWFLITPSIWYVLPTDLKFVPSDSTLVFGFLTLKQVGFVLLGGYALMVVVFMWRQYIERREFVWATALYLAFFMLPTQIHERYLFPAAVLSVIAIVQDRRMWFIALPLMISFTCNIVAVPNVHFVWLGLDVKNLLHGWEVATSAVSLLCLTVLVWIVVSGGKKTTKAITTSDTQVDLKPA